MSYQRKNSKAQEIQNRSDKHLVVGIQTKSKLTDTQVNQTRKRGEQSSSVQNK